MAKVAVGGTFDPLHDGHLALLKKAFEVAGERGTVVIALTSDEMAKNTRKRQVKRFEERLENLRRVLKEKFGVESFEVEKLQGIYGSAIEDDYDFIIVSPETEPVACSINEVRREYGLHPIKVVRIPYEMAEDDIRISSTRIVQGRIDDHGKLIPKPIS